MLQELIEKKVKELSVYLFVSSSGVDRIFRFPFPGKDSEEKLIVAIFIIMILEYFEVVCVCDAYVFQY